MGTWKDTRIARFMSFVVPFSSYNKFLGSLLWFHCMHIARWKKGFRKQICPCGMEVFHCMHAEVPSFLSVVSLHEEVQCRLGCWTGTDYMSLVSVVHVCMHLFG